MLFSISEEFTEVLYLQQPHWDQLRGKKNTTTPPLQKQLIPAVWLEDFLLFGMLWETEVEVTLASIQVTRRLRVLAKEKKYFTRPVYDLSGGKVTFI